jgi:tRNA uridine 5-carboxymethylaminomethyl modification enzyme
LKPDEVNQYLISNEESEISDTADLFTLTKRSNVKLYDLLNIKNDLPKELSILSKQKVLAELLQTEIKYEGYIKRQTKEVEYFLENESKKIPNDFDYDKLNSISTEARQKLKKVRPASLGQASRISGISASDVSVIAIYLKS